VRVTHPSVSKEHAVLFFANGVWVVKDLGSRNGTWANGTRLEPGSSVPIGKESVIQFGDVRAVLTCDSAPTLCVRDESSGECIVADGGLLTLPNEENPSASAYEASPGNWVVELDDRAQTVQDGDTFYLEGRRFLAKVPSADAPRAFQSTVRSLPSILLAAATLHIRVSQDEESIETSLVQFGAPVRVPPRATHQVLLALARQRLADRAEGVDEAEQGWIYSDELAKALAYDRERVNVDIHRLRQQFSALGVLDAARLIERRPTTRQLRLGLANIVLAE
jgi:hypothetical protein